MPWDALNARLRLNTLNVFDMRISMQHHSEGFWLDRCFFSFLFFWSTTTTDLTSWQAVDTPQVKLIGRERASRSFHLHTTRFEPRTLVRYFSREEEYDDICPQDWLPFFIHKRWLTQFVCFYSLFLICHWFFSMLVIMCFDILNTCAGFKACKEDSRLEIERICCCPLQYVL
jgi:hypothetical protein